MPIPESLGVFVAKIRKKFKSTTVDTFTLNRVYIMAVVELVKAYGYEEAMRRLFEWGYVMGHAYLMRLEKEIEKFPINVSSLRLLARTAWYFFSGTDPETHVEERKIDGKSWFVVQVRDKNSPWDRDFKLGKKVAYYPAGAYEGASNTFALIAGKGKWWCIARNTKSLAAGDPYTEVLTVYIPKDAPKEKVIESFPELFEDLSYEFSVDLYKRVISPE